jgi:hypothetical protein
MSPASVLVAIKTMHTLVWALLVTIIPAVPWFISRRRWRTAAILIAIVLTECAVVAFNSLRCPLTDIAARYTADRAPNFDIYLPVWLAANNKIIFGTLFPLELFWAVWKYAFLSRRTGVTGLLVETTSSS